MKFFLLLFLTICFYVNGFRLSSRNRQLINKKLSSIPETVTDPSLNLAAGILTTGTIFGAIEDLFKCYINFQNIIIILPFNLKIFFSTLSKRKPYYFRGVSYNFYSFWRIYNLSNFQSSLHL
jgi:hypothetical protein